MSSVHCVVVWEFQNGGQWVPHTPGVTRTLERAHAKKLTRVVLSDADPALKGHHVNLRTLTQCRDMPDGGTTECLVRRSCYSVQSVGGRGARWEWAWLTSPPLPAELHYEPMPMEMQCAVEEAWCAGAECVVRGGWALSAGGGAGGGAGGHARRGAAVRVLRRAPQPPYPLARSPATNHTVPARRPRIPQQHTGSSVHSVQSTLSAHSVHSTHSTHSTPSSHSTHANREMAPAAVPSRGGARSASPRDRKPNLARQILHNLNIFSNKQSAAPPDTAHLTTAHLTSAHLTSEARSPRTDVTDTECSSTVSTRRHSVDTVSTYLSHESKDSLQVGSVGELLNCSGGSDDVFESARPEPRGAGADPVLDLRTLGVGVGACSWVRSVACPQWGAVCPVCMQTLAPTGRGGCGGRGGEGAPRAVALSACQHMLHLHCLTDQLRSAVARAACSEEAIYIECLVCGRAYSAGAAPPPPPPPAPPAPPAAPPAPVQPPGSMAWRLQHASLPQCAPSTAILVTYNFQSGVQGAGQPAPGQPYYAVGFPRHSVLPDDELGRQVLSALRACWSCGVLFSVRASRTTGREHVVAWRVAPPPAAPHHYLPPARPRPLLLDALHALHALLEGHATQC